MSTEVLSPAVGNWYKTPEGPSFEVVALDEDEGTIEIQYFDGEVDELSFDDWGSSEIVSIAPPEDWSGPFDDLERDDLGYTDTNLPPEGHTFKIEDLD